MRDFKGIAVFYLCVAFTRSIFPESSAKWAGLDPTNWHVHVGNGLGGGRQLVVHCNSDVDDLGIHNLGPGGDFNWSFHVNIPGTAKFTCDWRAGNQHAVTDVFWSSGRRANICGFGTNATGKSVSGLRKTTGFTSKTLRRIVTSLFIHGNDSNEGDVDRVRSRVVNFQ